MATIQTLTTPKEVVEYTAVKLAFNTCTFRDIWTVEYNQADLCLGLDFLDDMIGALSDYSAATTWTTGSSYDTDEVVKHRGIYYQATGDGITSQPGTNSTDWIHAPKFADGDCKDKYLEAWEGYLGPYLCWTILEEQLPFIRRQISDRGVLEVDGDKYNTSSDEEFTILKHALNRRRYLSWKNWKTWINLDANKNLNCFSNYKPFVNNGEECPRPGGCEPRFKRTGIYKFG